MRALVVVVCEASQRNGQNPASAKCQYGPAKRRANVLTRTIVNKLVLLAVGPPFCAELVFPAPDPGLPPRPGGGPVEEGCRTGD